LPRPIRGGKAVTFTLNQDDLRKGAVRTFVDNGDGTITDFATGLMWEKKNDLGDVHDKDNTYTWSGISGNMDGSINSTILFLLNTGNGFAGHTDWRVPSRFELETLQNLGTSSPTTHFVFNSCFAGCSLAQCSCTLPERYWSSTTVAGTTSSAWAVGFSTANVEAVAKSTALAVRLVRDAPATATAPSCKLPDPPQCLFNDPCTNGFCSLTRAACSSQSDCPASPNEQCCCAGTCL